MQSHIDFTLRGKLNVEIQLSSFLEELAYYIGTVWGFPLTA